MIIFDQRANLFGDLGAIKSHHEQLSHGPMFKSDIRSNLKRTRHDTLPIHIIPYRGRRIHAVEGSMLVARPGEGAAFFQL